jgi:RNA polymerase sigma-70 factor, ECF subfamily
MIAPASEVLSSPPSRTVEVSDEELIDRARLDDSMAFELLMRRHNQRLYRVVRSVLREPAEIEDVIQQAYLSAFQHLDQFQGAARWSTWLCRIAMNEALARVRQRRRFVSMDVDSDERTASMSRDGMRDPESSAVGREVGELIEQAIDKMPSLYRSVLLMRGIEGMTTAETAAVLEVEPEVVKTRLHRARATLRSIIEDELGERMKNAYSFGNERCDRVVAAVLAQLSLRR